MALSMVACELPPWPAGQQRQRARWPAFAAGVLIVTLAIGGGILFFQPCDDEDAVTAQVDGFRQGRAREGTDEYTPLGADNASIQQHLPLVRMLHAAQDDTADSTNGVNPEWRAGDPGSIDATVDAQRWNGEHWECAS